MKCSECGLKLDPGAKEKVTCPRCNKVTLIKSTGEIPCEDCGEVLKVLPFMKSIICYSCGKEFIINFSDFSGITLEDSGITHKCVIDEPDDEDLMKYLH